MWCNILNNSKLFIYYCQTFTFNALKAGALSWVFQIHRISLLMQDQKRKESQCLSAFAHHIMRNTFLKSIESQLFSQIHSLSTSILKDASSHPHSVLIRQATVNPLPDDEFSCVAEKICTMLISSIIAEQNSHFILCWIQLAHPASSFWSYLIFNCYISHPLHMRWLFHLKAPQLSIQMMILPCL